MDRFSLARFAIASLLLPFSVPTVVFTICALASGLSVTETASALAEQLATRRQNLAICGGLGIFPSLLLLGGLWLHRRFGGEERARRAMAWGGLAAILGVLAWVNFQFWPLFLPERTYPGFPHGLEFVIGPLFFAPVAALFGVAIGWAAQKGKR